MTSLQPSLLRGSRAGPSSASSGKRSRQDDTQLPEAYQQQRPPWRPPLHSAAADQHVPDLFPTNPNQPEDDMSQISVRKGFAARPYVRNETFSAHEMIYTRLASPDTLQSLSSWMDEVIQRRRELDRANIAPSQYKAPSRVTLNEAKLANYVKDLADPNVPLTRLSRSVPHGFRGEKLFEMLWAGGALPSTAAPTANHLNPRTASSAQMPAPSSASTPSAAPSAPKKSVDISRAVWFIRALGAAELSSLRNKSAATIVPEITSNLCTWMAKQIAELNLVQTAESSSTAAASPAPVSPSTHLPRTPGAPSSSSLSRSVAAAHFARTPSNLNPASSPSPAPKEVCSVLQNVLYEERWTAKWSYSLSLARHLHAQHLLDRSILVRWIVDAFAASNLVQLPFLVELVQEVLVFILRRRCFVKPFLAALLVQIPALDARLDRTAGGGLRVKLLLLFRIVCETCPDALVSPRLWSEHAVTLTQLLHEINTDTEAETRPQRLSKSRSSDEVANASTQPPASNALQQHFDIQALDSFDMKTIDHVFLQQTTTDNRSSKLSRDDGPWAPRIETILTWACTGRRSGVARQYLAATLIEKIRFGVSWEESSEETDQVSLPAFDLDHHSKKTRKINVEPMLIKWLGDVEASSTPNVDPTTTNQTRSSLLATIEVASIVILVGELARRGVFSYTKYLQRLIARGMTSASSGNKDGTDAAAPAPSNSTPSSRDSLHLRLLRSLPLYDQPASVYQQRRQAIYGDRTKETYEDAAQRRALLQTAADVRDPRAALSLLVMADDFEGLAQLLATLLLRPLSDSLARAAFNMVIEFSLIWRSMDIMGTLNQLVRQQLNHSSSVRNDRQAVMASTTLLRLRTLIEGIPSRIHAPASDFTAEHDAIQQHVQALRPSVDALLGRFAKLTRSAAESRESSAPTPDEGSDILTPFRNLFVQADATSDEIIERTIVESILEQASVELVPAAVRLIDQLYLEASLEIDERHARWLIHLANSIEQRTYSETSVKALLALLIRLVAHGTLNLQLAMDTFLLPCLMSSVRRMTDPATRGNETASHLVAVVSSLADMFAGSLGEVGKATSCEDMRAFGAQTMLLFAQVNLPCLLRAAASLICASDESSPLNATEKTQVEAFWTSLLRDTCKSMWGCTPSRVMDQAMACLDPTSLLLHGVTSIDAASVKARMDGWDTAVVANELVEIFERLQLVESSFQSRADSKTKALASGIFDDLFVRLPDIGAQLMRDCQSSGLISRFTDIGIKTLSDKVKAQVDAVKTAEQLNMAKKQLHERDRKPAVLSRVEVESTMRSVLRMCEQQDSFIFNATDADSCGQLLLHVITSLEAAVSVTEPTVEDSVPHLSALLHSSMTFQLLHLVIRFGCLWNGSMKAVALRLVKTLLKSMRARPRNAAAASGASDVRANRKAAAALVTLDNTTTANGWFVASSAGAALKKGWFTPGGLNPWECAEYLNATPAGATAPGGAQARAAANPRSAPGQSQSDQRRQLSQAQERDGFQIVAQHSHPDVYARSASDSRLGPALCLARISQVASVGSNADASTTTGIQSPINSTAPAASLCSASAWRKMTREDCCSTNTATRLFRCIRALAVSHFGASAAERLLKAAEERKQGAGMQEWSACQATPFQ
ncbi:related to Mediator of RNA polymerase II transcription subunit 12 [Ustilago trichophora]|uniref:Mediator of RNA polymerase II transcription subunit 12 n=1 Tax=Ustilago trichophora TaxID=86804 RepID=A0A5C3E7X4_9BASI|nr:related to Mediator of RNA polymerase II transcription subunit 12 [Ustilago trichophora]